MTGHNNIFGQNSYHFDLKILSSKNVGFKIELLSVLYDNFRCLIGGFLHNSAFYFVPN